MRRSSRARPYHGDGLHRLARRSPTSPNCRCRLTRLLRMPAPVHRRCSVSPHLMRLWKTTAASRRGEGAWQSVAQHHHAPMGHLAVGGGKLPAHSTHAHAKDHRPFAVEAKNPPRNSSTQGEHGRPLGGHPKHVEEAASVSGADEDLLHRQQVE